MAVLKRKKSKASASQTVRALLIEVPIYAALVVAYFFLVLHFLGDWLGQEHKGHVLLYAFTCIGLIIGQAI
ncbi:MAG: hypothetical protein M3R10_02720, partial [Verrucomicrobiota bacterium]|nr:hypothetical protein [Verrucomicrobiota bacterium]